MVGTVLSQIINFISSPVLTRLFTPEEFGFLSLYTSVIGPLTVVATLRLETALVIAQDGTERVKLKEFLYALVGRFTLFLFVALAVFAWTVPERFETWYAFLPLGLFFTAVQLVENSDRNHAKEYRHIARGRVVQAIVMAVLAIALGQFTDIAVALILAQLAAVFVSWVYLRRGERHFWQFARNVAPFGDIAKNYSRYLRFTMPASLLDVLSQQIPVFILGYYATKELTGFYGLALKVLILPTSIIGGSVAQVFLRRFSELWNEHNAPLKRQLLKTWGMLLALGVVPYTLLWVFGPELFSLVFGQNWTQAGVFASVIAPMLFCNFVSGPSSSAILVQNNHKMGFYFGLNALVTRGAALFYGAHVGDIMLGFRLWVIVEILSMIAYNATIWVHVLRREKEMAR